MPRHKRGKDGLYHIAGRKYRWLVGTRKQVKILKSAYKTTYGKVRPRGDALTAKDLFVTKRARVVSRVKHNKGPALLRRLHDRGYYAKKGEFGVEYRGDQGRSRRRRRGRPSRRTRRRGRGQTRRRRSRRRRRRRKR